MSIQGQAALAASAAPLPAAIGFLAGHGVAPQLLRRAAALSRTTGVPADAALLKTGLMPERAFYRALAAELGVPFLDGALVADAGARFPENIQAGIVPLAPHHGAARFALAPAGEALAELLRRGRPLPAGCAITTPTDLARAVFARRAGSIAWRAAHALPHARPDQSFRGGWSPGQAAACLALVALGAFGATLAPAVVLTAAMTLCGLVLLGLVTVRIAAVWEAAPTEPPRPPPRLPNRALPLYTIIVPLYRESRILERLIASISALDYPAAKLDVKIVTEAGDHETAAALARLALPGFVEVLVAPAGLPKTKPRALNVALPLARGVYTVIYDAEDVPDPGQLRLAAAAFARMPPDFACLQARLVIDNTDDSWLTRFFTLEYAALFDVVNPALAGFDLPVPLGGTSNHFRTDILRGLHGWDAWNVTEDADLGIRLARAGYRVADLPSATLEEAPSTLRAWLRQRTRWMKGFMQTCITHARRPAQAFRALGPVRFAGAVTVTFGTLLAALGYPFFTALALLALIDGTLTAARTPLEIAQASLGLTLFAAGLVAMLGPAVAAIRRRKLWRLLAYAPLLPFYYALVSVAAWCGLFELILDPSRWNKTEHGLARTSRAGLVTGRAGDPGRPARADGRG